MLKLRSISNLIAVGALAALVACGGDDEATPIDAPMVTVDASGPDAAGLAQTCANYCTLITANCNGNLAMYADAATCKFGLREGGQDLQRRIGRAYQDVAEAWGLGVAKVPAVVVDRRYVVYGESDIARAAARIETYRRTQP